MSVLVFGKSGQVAREIQRILPDAVFLSRDDVDLSDPEACKAVIRAHEPCGILNAAAWTAVDAAEDAPDAAFQVNAEAPKAMAEAARDVGSQLVHISTDYVFDGSGSAPWQPEDKTGPLGVYGASKLAGEDAIRASGAPYAILRTSWVVSAHGANFVKTMLRLSETRDALNIVDDQVGGPTPAAAIAEACVTMSAALAMDPDKTGTYHFSGAQDTTWADFARAIFDYAGRDVSVTGIPTKDYPTPAQRPLNSRLDCSSIEATFGLRRPDWRLGLRDILTELGANPT